MSRTNKVSTLLASGSSGSLVQTRQLLSSGSSAYVDLGQSVSATASALAQLESAVLAQAASVTANAKAASTTSGGGTNVLNTAGNLAESVLGGFTLSPIVRGLMSLFGGGGDTSVPASLPIYTAPSRISMEGGVTADASGVVATDHGQNGQARAISSGSQAQVTVNVQAMDSQSFLDRRDDIARAVKRAMLESNSLNDVVAEV